MRRYVTKQLRSCAPGALLALCAQAQADEVAVPKDLEDWRGWVLQGEEFRRCPFRRVSGHQCPRSVSLRLARAPDPRAGCDGRHLRAALAGVRGKLGALPGNVEHWPQDVRVDGAPGAVVARDGSPHLCFWRRARTPSRDQLAWPARPESHRHRCRARRSSISRSTADASRSRSARTAVVWLGKRRTPSSPRAWKCRCTGWFRTTVPARLVTRIRLQVSGDGREELLARVLPDGFTPLCLQSALPARLEPDGRLRVQVRAGSWDIDSKRAVPASPRGIARPPAGEGLWAK